MNRHFPPAVALSLVLSSLTAVRAADDPPTDSTLAHDQVKAVSDTVKHDAKVVADAAKDSAKQVAVTAKEVAHEVCDGKSRNRLKTRKTKFKKGSG